jgi:phenylpropionate dioxygenase-like ring-hydroxylating dioxygenase large terminal subunit
MTATFANVRALDQLVQDDRVHHSVYTEPDIFRQEMQKVFGRTWVYLAHESEIAGPGDFVTRHIGLQPVIVVRDQGGAVNVFLNRCRHRGAMVCREASGNASHFRCMYHGWTYRADGQLTGVPLRERYPDSFDLTRLGLVAVPRIETYRGLIFACLDPEVEGLSEFLGGARQHVDVILDFGDDSEIEVRCGCTKHVYRGNWKLQAENGADGYHNIAVHESHNLVAKRRGVQNERDREVRNMLIGVQGKGWCEGFGHGHSIMARPPDPAAVDKLRSQYPEWSAKLAQKHSLKEMLVKHNLYIFPNLYLRFDHLRVIQPKRVDLTEVLMYPYRLKGAPEAINVGRLRSHEGFMSPAGSGTPDDMATFDLVQEGLQAEGVDWVYLARGIHDEVVREDGVRVSADASDELPMRELYREWKRLMAET